MKDIKVVVNSYLVLGGYYGIRPRAEVVDRIIEKRIPGVICDL